MSEEPAPTADRADRRSEPERSEAPRTPFDHPLFLPVLFFAGSAWFGYDGWLNDDPKMLEHLSFNRVGFAVLVPLALWFGYRGLRRMAAEKKAGQAPDAD